MATKVLLVDDEIEYLNALSTRLKVRGFDVQPATSGTEAIEKTKNTAFDAVVLDYAMPGLDGLETLKQIKQINPNIQVIMLTGHATVKTGVQAMKEGAMDLLQKPVDFAMLVEKIGEASARTVHIVEKSNEEHIHEILLTRSW